MIDSVNHPDHYTSQKIECIEVIEMLNMDFRLSNVIKYIWRHREKNGIEDLKKAQWYLDRFIKKHEQEMVEKEHIIETCVEFGHSINDLFDEDSKCLS